jgi:hypothetical protein
MLQILAALNDIKLLLLYFFNSRNLCSYEVVMNWRCISGGCAARRMCGMSGVSQSQFLCLYIIQMAGRTPLVCDRSNMTLALQKISSNETHLGIVLGKEVEACKNSFHEH